VAYCAVYIFLQAFSIPGSFVMNLLGGVLYPVSQAVPLIAALTAVGSLCCYVFSSVFGKPFFRMLGLLPKLEAFGRRVERARRENTLLFFLLTIRAFPMSPHWFLNLTSYWVGVPAHLFTLSILVGKIPYVWAIVSAGAIVGDITADTKIISFEQQLMLAGLALLASAPAILMRFFSGGKVAGPWELLFGEEEAKLLEEEQDKPKTE
jgi:uncharacterized membrane protein YdjX (TVP38/TMEM64 family)